MPQTQLKAQASTPYPMLVGAGDIARCDSDGDEQTAALVETLLKYTEVTVFTLGDNVYNDGTAAEFEECYAPSWGRFKTRTRPVPGNHDYNTPDGTAYYAFFGAAAGNPKAGYYSYDLGTWHIVVLNSNISFGTGSMQRDWLSKDLKASRALCTIAMWHHPRFSSGTHGNDDRFVDLWELLYQFKVDVILNGHDHTYERFAPQTPDGQLDPIRGIREFVVGTGGAPLYAFEVIREHSEIRRNDMWGVLQLILKPESYEWSFLSVSATMPVDTGESRCVK
ncbi:MAG: metallophosphoesterase [Anaerolineae bacterium]|nr:metallophosphoesterase [Anaerolineae bacterium]